MFFKPRGDSVSWMGCDNGKGIRQIFILLPLCIGFSCQDLASRGIIQRGAKNHYIIDLPELILHLLNPLVADRTKCLGFLPSPKVV